MSGGNIESGRFLTNVLRSRDMSKDSKERNIFLILYNGLPHPLIFIYTLSLNQIAALQPALIAPVSNS